MTKPYTKALHIVDKYINCAKAYKAKHGYKENLGYEYRPKVLDEVSKLHLEYTEECEVMRIFESKCDEL